MTFFDVIFFIFDEIIVLKILSIFFLFSFFVVSAQQKLPFDSLKLKDAKELFADDYGNIYLYRNKDFSFTKYDSLGKQKGKLLFALPFRIQSVQNPLSIPTFSENAQELKLFDQNLNEIQKVNFREKFGQIKRVFAEDLQQIWLLDESTKRLIQYNFREEKTINAYPFDIDFETIIDFQVDQQKVYFLTSKNFTIYDFNAKKLTEIPINFGRRIVRENQNILIIGQKEVSVLENAQLNPIFKDENAQIVDKNTASYFVIKQNKLYLYPIQKTPRKNANSTE
ncbi:hypothetical protein [Kaistella montana]|uniref:Uncharacterized protein n=1 Tax=Kaistella montana TaxID=1849733 RepID=A0ABW5K939_9FLAO|nr:hypothetical protein [Kaistella montana]MCQ4035047.1 hypothetical protein [Kaistella montana]